MYKKVPGRPLLFERLEISQHRTMTPNAEEYTAWELWTQCDHTIAISIMHSRQLDDIKIVVIGAQSIKHSLGAAEELYTVCILDRLVLYNPPIPYESSTTPFTHSETH